MRAPSILDVVRAVKSVAGRYKEVSAWWYAPPKRLMVSGESPESRARRVEVAVVGERAACDAIAEDLSRALGGAPAIVRPYRGPQLDGHLFRLLTAAEPRS